MADYFANYELDRHTSAFGGFRTGWWFGFYGNVPGAGVATVYAIAESGFVAAVSNCAPYHSINTKNTNFAVSPVTSLWPGTAFEEINGYSRSPRLYYQGVMLDKDTVTPWKTIKVDKQGTDFAAAVGEDGELYVCGMDILRHINPQFVCMPVPETLDSQDQAIQSNVGPARFASASVNNGSNVFFRITTDGFGTKWQDAVATKEGTDAVEPYSLFALDVNGYLYSCGETRYLSSVNKGSKLGLGTAVSSVDTLTQVGTNTYTKLSVSQSHGLAIGTDGVLYTWGNISPGGSGVFGYSVSGLKQSSIGFKPEKVSGIVREITITNPGSGYTGTPAVTFTGASVETAKATAVRDTATNTITSINITEGGVGYTTVPTISIAAPAGTGVSAAAVCSITTAFSDCFAGNLWSLAVDSDGYALAVGSPEGDLIGPPVNFTGRRSFKPIPSTATFATCNGGDRGQEVAYFFTQNGDAFGVGRNEKGQLATGYTSTVENSFVACGTHTTWITMLPAGDTLVRHFGIARNQDLYAWGQPTSVNSQNTLALQNTLATTATAIAIPLPAGPVGDKWKHIHGSGSTVFIRDDELSPEVDYA